MASSSRNGASMETEVLVQRHSSHQLRQLEMFFQDCQYPSERQRHELSEETGLSLSQIKFWFQNKRTQNKALKDLENNAMLRKENEEIRCENVAIIEALKNIICPTCVGAEGERDPGVQKLQQENVALKREYDRVSSLLASYTGKAVPPFIPSFEPEITTSAAELNSTSDPYDPLAEYSDQGILTGVEKAVIRQTAVDAIQELTRMLEINESLWAKSSYHGRYVLIRGSYEKIFNKSYHNYITSRVESSKESAVVKMNALDLVGMFVDSDKWKSFFPTILTDAETIQELHFGARENYSGSLQLMYGKMHILSPLVPKRDFYFIRYCQMIVAGLWLIVDASYDYEKKEHTSPSLPWKFPSGCMIQDLNNGFSRVIWVEHVQVDDRNRTHRLFTDLICEDTAYGAERWVAALQRMCERITSYVSTPDILPQLNETVINGSKKIMARCHRMVKSFYASLDMSTAGGKQDFQPSNELTSTGVRISVRKSTAEEVGHELVDGAMIVTAASSIWLPLSHHQLSYFFNNPLTRVQWDTLSNGKPMHEAAQISTGADEGNLITLFRPLILMSEGDDSLVLQERWTDAVGSVIVYAQTNMRAINKVMSGDEIQIGPSKPSNDVPLLPSGIVISSDGRPLSNVNDSSAATGVGGSIVTVVIQVLISSPSSSEEDSNIERLNNLISAAVRNIKLSLNFPA